MKEKKAKLKLEDIKVESFVTSNSTKTVGEGCPEYSNTNPRAPSLCKAHSKSRVVWKCCSNCGVNLP
jgi:hypothetical protein